MAWHEPPGHQRGLSQYLASPETGARLIDFRLSRYPPGGLVESHVHAIAEQVFYFLEGTGQVTLDHAVHLVEGGMVLYVPPGVEHSVVGTGTDDLVFVVATAPADDIERG